MSLPEFAPAPVRGAHRSMALFLRDGQLTATMQIAERIYSLAQEQNDPALMLGACRALAGTLFFLGDFESAQQYAQQGLQIWRSGRIQANAEEYYTPIVICLTYKAWADWQLGEIASCRANMDEAISIAKELNDTSALALALSRAAALAVDERNPVEAERFASALIELSTRHHFVHWLAAAAIWRGWARSASGDIAEGIPWIERGIKELRATGAMLGLSSDLALKAEALHLADRTSRSTSSHRGSRSRGAKNGRATEPCRVASAPRCVFASLGADET